MVVAVAGRMGNRMLASLGDVDIVAAHSVGMDGHTPLLLLLLQNAVYRRYFECSQDHANVVNLELLLVLQVAL